MSFWKYWRADHMEDPSLSSRALTQRMFHVVPNVDRMLHTLSLN